MVDLTAVHLFLPPHLHRPPPSSNEPPTTSLTAPRCSALAQQLKQQTVAPPQVFSPFFPLCSFIIFVGCVRLASCWLWGNSCVPRFGHFFPYWTFFFLVGVFILFYFMLFFCIFEIKSNSIQMWVHLFICLSLKNSLQQRCLCLYNFI